ncbi:MAG: 3-isopropylmalate dehydrogenase [Eubacteriales bacterium]|nr:3-isopropylmalate dehydrogenase [Eubacteriales bacterium]
MNKRIAVICGDGIGQEVIPQAVRVLDAVGVRFGHVFTYEYVTAGGASIDLYGTPLTEENLNRVLEADAVLLGALGGDKWDHCPERPEKALLLLRKSLGVYANLRPAVLYPTLADISPLRSEITERGVDIMVVRELTGGLYYGQRATTADGAYDTMSYSVREINRILRVGFESAMLRRRRLTVVDKANILDTSKLWRRLASEMEREYPAVSVDYLYVDNASMQLVLHPDRFDVIVTENTFGDILSDETGAVVGSLGMIPSASLGDGAGLYEPVHGSAPDIAGKNIANPIAAILSAAMMLEYSFGLKEEAAAIRAAVEESIRRGVVTRDIARDACSATTREVGDYITRFVEVY